MNEGPAWSNEVFGGRSEVDGGGGWRWNGSPIRVFWIGFMDGDGCPPFCWSLGEELGDVWVGCDPARHGESVRRCVAMERTHLFVIGAENELRSRSPLVGNHCGWS